MSATNQPSLTRLSIATDLGEFTAAYSERGLAELRLPPDKHSVAGKSPSTVPPEVRHWHRLTSAALKEILAGRAAGELPPLDWSGATEFQQSVWRAMLEIPAGETRSYGEIARTIGNPKAVRAVGGACGANLIPVLVPCHRVLAAHREIGGFSGGLDWKRRLLAREGVEVS